MITRIASLVVPTGNQKVGGETGEDEKNKRFQDGSLSIDVTGPGTRYGAPSATQINWGSHGSSQDASIEVAERFQQLLAEAIEFAKTL